jgi:hypothetical protein
MTLVVEAPLTQSLKFEQMPITADKGVRHATPPEALGHWREEVD